jgi:glucarate dehydratase
VSDTSDPIRVTRAHGDARIQRIVATPVNVPMVAPYRFSFGTLASFTTTIVEVTDSDGVTGIGEAPHGDLSRVVDRHAQRLAGRSIHDLNDHARRCVGETGFSMWADAAADRRAYGAIELALVDLQARRAGVRVVDLLGGPIRDRVEFTEYFAFRVGRDETPSQVVDHCVTMAADHGSRAFEGKLGVLDPVGELAMVDELVRTLGPGAVQRLDANGAYTVATARQVIPRLAVAGVGWLEDPCRTLDEVERLRADGAPISFSTHEADLVRAARRGVPDGICVDVSELGGIRAAHSFAQACGRLGVDFWCYSGDAGVMTAAYLHLSAAEPSMIRPHQSLFEFTADVAIEQGRFRPVGDHLTIPDGPGLGVTIDRGALARMHQRFVDEGSMSSGDDAGYGTGFRQW